MALRRIFFQLGALAGGVAFLVTFWRSLGGQMTDPLQAAVRAILAGAAVMVCALLIYKLIENLGGPVEEQQDETEVDHSEGG